MSSNLEKTRELNSSDSGENTAGLYPIPDGKIYLAMFSQRHDGKHMFYAVDDGSAIQYIKEVHPNLTPLSLSEVTISYRDIRFLDAGMRVQIPAGEYEILTKSEDEEWGETGKLLHTDKERSGILLKYVGYPDYGWNIYLPDMDFLIFVSRVHLDGRHI